MKNSVIFQACSWYTKDTRVVNNNQSGIQFVIKVFGRTEDGQSIALSIHGFKPYFFIKLKRNYNLHIIKSKLNQRCFHMIHNIEPIKRKEFFGYTNFEEYDFLKMSFHSFYGFKTAKTILQDEGNIHTNYKNHMYESNVKPEMRFFHDYDIDPCGWIMVDLEDDDIDIDEDGNEHTNVIEDDMGVQGPVQIQANIELNPKKLRKVTDPSYNLKVAPFVVASFDIECNSFSGCLPAPERNYIFYSSQLKDYFKRIGKHKGDIEFTDVILSSLGYKDDNYELAKSQGMPTVKVQKRKDDKFPSNFLKADYVDQLRTLLSDVSRNTEDVGYSLEREFEFPKFEGDPIIQIGTTVQLCGDDNILKKYIIVTDDCDPIDGVTIIRAKNEVDLLLKWKDLIVQTIDPDFVTGYNIFGFDFEYMYKRSKILNIEHNFMKLSRIHETNNIYRHCRYAIDFISSSAMNDNELKYILMPGRVLIDMMKVIQKEYKLQSYTLNNVAKTYLNSQKDDLSPKEMFKIYKEGGSHNIRTIAKYCVQDCALCNQLVTKLQIIVNSISMANVCSVPINYIVTKGGQGVKIYSLVVKECAKHGFMIKDKKYEEPDKGTREKGYEGACVLECQEGLYVDTPVAVLDYNSLYPSCIMAYNLTPEYTITEQKFLQKAKETFDVEFAPGRIATFVQPQNGQKGIIPSIFECLLQKRKDAKKRMEASNDKFEKNILNGMQLAYKVTANSIYGQLGAQSSPLYFQQIAASTTAIGRNMLYNACDFLKQHYQAKIIYGDTDSLFIIFPHIEVKGKEAILPVIDIAKQSGEEFSKNLKKPFKLEYEKVFCPLLLMSKKRYAGHLYENDDKSYYLKTMGDVMVRNDTIPFVKRIYQKIIDMILEHQDVDGSIKYFQEELTKLLNGNIPIEELTLSFTLKSSYENANSLRHCRVAHNMALRDPASKPNVNERVPLVYIKKKTGSRPNKADISEHPSYVKEMNLPIDYEIYAKDVVQNPIMTVYTIMAPIILKHVDFEQCYTELLDFYKDPEKAKDEFQKMKEKYVRKKVFGQQLLNIIDKK